MYYNFLEESKSLGFLDVPEPQGVNAEFVYNFFVPTERTDESNPLSSPLHGSASPEKISQASTNSLRHPRYITISWSSVDVGSSQDLNWEKNLVSNYCNQTGGTSSYNSEDTVSSKNDVVVSISDNHIRKRLAAYADTISSLVTDSSDIFEKLDVIASEVPGLDLQVLQSVVSPGAKPGLTFVNNVGQPNEIPAFTKAANLTIKAQIDKRCWSNLLASPRLDINPPSMTMFEHASDPSVSTDIVYEKGDDPVELFVLGDPEKVEFGDPAQNASGMECRTVGYILERTSADLENSQNVSFKRYLIDGDNETNFIDTNIVYGKTYSYSVRTVSLVTMHIQAENPPGSGDGGSELILNGHLYKCRFLVSSSSSKSYQVKTVEDVPPLAPDGVQYRFNYTDGKGLILFWQIPAGRQRDVKYFQVFRRKSIYEPYVCIAEIDFDDSEIKSSRSEMVNGGNIIKSKRPMTSFEDKEFTRDNSGYMYAVTAIDAHGLTSGYSVQTLVDFMRLDNKIRLKTISRSGAPKQYPNFFVDPDLDDNILVDSLTQDSMRVSQKMKATVYFDPDAVKYESSVHDAGGAPVTQPGNVIVFSNNISGDASGLAFYKLHFLNVDRQKASTVEIKINDAREAS